ncbi:NAD(+) synthase [Thalassoroseus pseudoceratinae]|uniref:NAD(+) synthase n=1 Tax=Thalassoroseus pseudoceratinae TaxID=2713176 RepID=UPI0014212DD0|nr:NAD(+) synthase [Thalassoroseus pseudoceratinae]
MQLIKVAAAALNQTPLDWQNNAQNIADVLAQARSENVGALCLPELCITGYGCEDAFHSTGVWQTAWDVLQELLPETRGMVVGLGLPIFHQDAVFNAVAVACDGKLQGFVAKQYLAGDGIHYEPRWFKAWPAEVVTRLHRGLDDYQIGDLTFQFRSQSGKTFSLGFEICEDAWVANRPGSRLAGSGVDVILNPSASHFAFGKNEVRKRFVLEGSRAFGVTYVYANLLGNESGRAIYDGGTMIATNGRMLTVGSRFRYHNVQLASAVVDVDLTRMNQARVVSFKPDLELEPHSRISVPFEFPTVDDDDLREVSDTAFNPAAKEPEFNAWETGAHVKEEEFTRAIALALFDYMRKSRSRGFVVSLSGGADSAACAMLVALMVEFAVRDLGADGFAETLSFIPELKDCPTVRDCVQRLLTTAYQGTANSGDVTRNAARKVAETIGATHYEFDVENIAAAYRETISDAIGRPLTWEQDDITLQNIQARVRAPSVWMLANLNNALLLATSNRSEAAVGYATMDGDTSGGLSPIAGIDKAFLRRWLSWLETVGPHAGRAVPELELITRQAPTAELRPQSAGQTDEDDLMPYPLLDAIERAAIRDKQMPVEVLRYMQAEFPQFERQQLVEWIRRFFRLWSRNQWKRERYAPSFHVDDKNLDPKTWCRFPILSGGFERELRQLDENTSTEGRSE